MTFSALRFCVQANMPLCFTKVNYTPMSGIFPALPPRYHFFPNVEYQPHAGNTIVKLQDWLNRYFLHHLQNLEDENVLFALPEENELDIIVPMWSP